MIGMKAAFVANIFILLYNGNGIMRIGYFVWV
jgi:hypothetical protein